MIQEKIRHSAALASPRSTPGVEAREIRDTIIFVAGLRDGLNRTFEAFKPHPQETISPLASSLHLLQPEYGEVFGVGKVSREANRAYKSKRPDKSPLPIPSTLSTFTKNIGKLMPEVKHALQQSPQKISGAIEGIQHSLSGAFPENKSLKLSLPRAALIALTIAYLGGIASSAVACTPMATADQIGTKTEQSIQIPASVNIKIKPILIPYLETVLGQKYLISINGREQVNPEFEVQKDKYFKNILAEQVKAIDRQFPADKSRITIEPSAIPSRDGYVYSFFLDGKEIVYTGFDTNGHKGFFTFAHDGSKHKMDDNYQFRLDGNRYGTVYFYYFEDKFGNIIDPETNIFIPEQNDPTSDIFYKNSKRSIVDILRGMANNTDGRDLGKSYTVFHELFNSQFQRIGILEIINIEDGSKKIFAIGPNGRVDPVPLQ